jgi:hypothetical protein
MQLTSFRDRLRVVDENRAVEQAPPRDSPEADPWFNLTARIKGSVDWLGTETVQSQQICDLLKIPMKDRRSSLWRRITKLMVAHGWTAIRIKKNGIDGGGVTERIRGFERKTNKLPVQVTPDRSGKCQTDTPYIFTHVIARLEQDSRFALGRSIRALVAERDALREQLAGCQCKHVDQ